MSGKITLPLQVGIVGCGGIAQVVHIPLLKKQSELEIAAICDVDHRKIAVLADRYNISNAFDDIEEMLYRCRLDALFILTPTSMHLPMSLMALEQGVHLFVERPLARNAQEARQIQEAARQHDRQVMVGMHYRFRGDIQIVKGVLDNQTLGEIFFIKGEWLQSRFQAVKQPWQLSKNIAGGGVTMELGIQLLDISWWLTNRPAIKAVKAYARQIDPDLDVEDFCSIYLRFERDLEMSFQFSWNFPVEKDRFSMELFGTNGRGSLNPFEIEKLWKGKTLDISPQGYSHRTRDLFKLAYKNEIAHFINFLTGKEKRLESSINDAIQLLEFTDAIYKSLASNREVQFT